MAKKKVVEQVEEVVIQADNVTLNTERNGDPAGAKADMDLPADVKAVVEENAPMVQTGKDIRDGKPVMKPAPIKPKAEDFSEGRKLFPVHTSVEGSFNTRKISLKQGEKVYLNEDELAIFRNYVSGSGE